MGEAGQAQDGWNQSIVDQTPAVLDAADASHNGKDMSQEKIGRMIVSVGVVGPVDVELEEVPHTEGFAEQVEKA